MSPAALLKNLWPWLLILAAGLLAYSNVYYNAPVYDDLYLLLRNQFLVSWSSLGDIFTNGLLAGSGVYSPFYRPLQNLCYLIIVQLFGPNVVFFHMLNVGLHLANALLIYVLGQRLGLARTAALFAALLWVVHPIHTEAVTYMSGTADPLAALFMLLGLYIWRPDSWKHQLGVAVCFVLALLTKEAALVFPGVLVVRMLFTYRPREDWKLFVGTWPYWVIAITYYALHAYANDFKTHNFFGYENIYTESMWVRFTTFLAALPQYALLLVHPTELHIDRLPVFYANFFNPLVLGGLVFFVAGVAAVIGSLLKPECQYLRLAALAAGWFLVAYFPSSGIVVPVNSIVLEHWMYFPAIGGFYALAALVVRVLEDRPVLKKPIGAAALVVVGLFTVGTLQQNTVWANGISLFENVVKYEETAPRVRYGLALLYLEAGNYQKAVENFQKAVEKGVLDPMVHVSYAELLQKMGDVSEAENQYLLALQVDPTIYSALIEMQKIHLGRGETEKAAEYEARAAAVSQGMQQKLEGAGDTVRPE